MDVERQYHHRVVSSEQVDLVYDNITHLSW